MVSRSQSFDREFVETFVCLIQCSVIKSFSEVQLMSPIRLSVSLFLGIVASVLVSPNLNAGFVINGDFEDGFTGFTSQYTYAPGGNSTEGQFTVRSDP